jgi:hypothetical protein
MRTGRNIATREDQRTMQSRSIAANRTQKMPMAQFRGDENRLQMTQIGHHGISPNTFPRGGRRFSKSKPPTVESNCLEELRDSPTKLQKLLHREQLRCATEPAVRMAKDRRIASRHPTQNTPRIATIPQSGNGGPIGCRAKPVMLVKTGQEESQYQQHR